MRLIDGRAAFQGMDNPVADLLLLIPGYDADSSLPVLPKDEMSQHHTVQICSEDAQYHRLLVIDQRRAQGYQHAAEAHSPAEIHVQVSVHDLCHNVQPSRGGVPIEQNAQPDAHYKDIAGHIQGRIPGKGTVIRQQKLEQT